MTPKQKSDFNKMRDQLLRISKHTMTTTQLQKDSEKEYGLDYEEALGMAYDNIKWESALVVKGVKAIK